MTTHVSHDKLNTLIKFCKCLVYNIIMWTLIFLSLFIQSFFAYARINLNARLLECCVNLCTEKCPNPLQIPCAMDCVQNYCATRKY